MPGDHGGKGRDLVWRRLKAWAQRAERDALAIYFAIRDPRVPWYAKALALVIAMYALSPIDLIPDVIPVLGLLGDILIVAVGVWLVIRLIPPGVMAELRDAAQNRLAKVRLGTRIAAAVIVLHWLALIGLAAWLIAGLAD